jgi:tetratricopeptide (TPR) repeat protein
LVRLKRYENALKAAERLEENDARNINVPLVRAQVLGESQQYDEAIALYEEMLQRNDLNGAVYAGYGYVLSRVGRYVDAARMYAQALAIDAQRITALNNLGSVYFTLQYYERALDLYARVLAHDEKLLVSLLSTAETLVGLERYDEAQAWLERARTLQEPHGTLRSEAVIPAIRGNLYTRQKRYDEALAAFKEAFAIDADNDEARLGFAELLLALGETEKAVAAIEKAMPLNAYDARAWSLKVRILRAVGDEAGASEAETHGVEMLAQQRAELAAFEREHPEWANFGKEG